MEVMEQTLMKSSLIALLFLIALPSHSFAETTTNPSYQIDQIEMDTLDQTRPTPQPSTLPLTKLDTMQTLLPNVKYTIYSTNDAFSITNSQATIDFGALSATNPVTRTARLSLKNPLQGAQVIASENRPMTATNKQFVPDTTCDNGTCTASIPSVWENTLTYGFGYRCESTQEGVCDLGFALNTTYKQFADTANNESYQTIMTSMNAKQTTEATIRYKINISGTQPLGGYRNTITYIAVPNF